MKKRRMSDAQFKHYCEEHAKKFPYTDQKHEPVNNRRFASMLIRLFLLPIISPIISLIVYAIFERSYMLSCIISTFLIGSFAYFYYSWLRFFHIIEHSMWSNVKSIGRFFRLLLRLKFQ